MSTRLRIASWLLAAVALVPYGASARPGRAAAPLADPAARAAVDWRPVEVMPVKLAGPAWAAAPEPGAEATRAAVVGPETGALIRLGSLASVQVRAEAVRPGRPVKLRFWRRTGEPGSGRAAVEEPGVELSPGTWLLEHPPGGPGEWLISAAEPARISAVTPAARKGEMIWEHVAGAVLEWIERGGEPPPLPELPAAADLRRELLADAAVAAALAKSDPKDMSLQKAVKAWRGAAALQRIAALRPAGRPAFALEPGPRPLAGAEPAVIDGRAWQRVDGSRTWELRMTGPGVAWISAKLLGQDPKASLTVTAGGRRLAHERLAPALTCLADVPCPEGGPVRNLAIPLAPGEHTYRVRFRGEAALVQVKAGRTLERLAAALRRESVADLVHLARRELAGSRSPRAPLVDALLARVDGRPPPALPRLSTPALALTRHWLEAEAEELERDLPRRRRLAAALARTADAVADPHLAARARAAGIELLQGTGDPALARRLVGPRPAEAPARALAVLAPLVDGPPLPLASPALALLERARRRAPHDADLRAAYRDHWHLTRWSTLLPHDDGPPAMTWIERLPVDLQRTATGTSLWTWPNGHEQKVMAPALAEAPARPAQLRLYARADASLTVTVDDRRWRTLPLAPLELIELALPPGEHALTVAGPPGGDVWSSLPPTPERAPDARLLRLWGASPERPARFALPGEPAFVRVDVRGLDLDQPTVVDLSLKTDTGLRRRLTVELRPSDFTAVPLGGSPHLGPPTSVVVPLDLRARTLEVSVARGGPHVAVSAAVRAPGTREAAAALKSSDARAPGGKAELAPVLADDAPAPVPEDSTGAPVPADSRSPASSPVLSDSRSNSHAPKDSRSPAGSPAPSHSRSPVPEDSLSPAPADSRSAANVSAGSRSPAPADSHTPKPVPEDSPRTTAPAPDLGDSPLAIVERASRGLIARPDDPELLIARAGALLDLDQRPYALSDWTRLTARPLPPALRPRAQALGARIETLGAPTHVDVKTTAPVLIAPALAAAELDDLALARLAPAAARAREAGPAAGLAALDDLAPLPPAAEDDLKNLSGKPHPGPRGPNDSYQPAWAAPKPGRKDKASAAPSAAAGAKNMSSGTPPTSISKDMSSGTSTGAGVLAAPAPKALPLATPSRTDPAELAVRAALLDAAARPAEAFRAWHRVYAATERWQVGLAGARSALAALDDPSTAPDGASLAYGLALRVRPTIRAPFLDRLANIAGERSRWSHLILGELHGSREVVDLPKQPAPVTANTDARTALLAAPFDTRGALILRPGVPVLIDLARGHDRIGFDLWCREVRPELGGAPPTVRFWMGEELLHTADVPHDVAARADFAVPARDAVTIELDDASHASLCLARLHRPDARQVARTDRWHVARARRPVEFIVLGPTTVQIEVHGRPASDLNLAIARGSEPFGPARRLDLASGQVPKDMSKKSLRSEIVSAPVQVLTLADSGPLRMRLAPGVGQALVRVHQRLDAEAQPPPPRPPRGRPARLQESAPPALPEVFDRPPAATKPAVARRVQRFGTPYADLHFGTDDLEDSDDLRPRLSGVVRLGWARELLARRLWIEVNPELRPREGTALTAGGRLTVQAFFPRAGLRASVSGLGLVQTEQPSAPWSLRGEARLDRPTWLAPRLQLLPGLDLAYRYQSLAPGHGFGPGELHPRVYQWYVEDHPFVLRPTLDLRVVAWQDARVVVGADMVPNSDFRSVDQVSVHAGMAGALALYGRFVPEFALDYEASVRFKDADRDRTYLRHRILAGLGLGVWLDPGVRLAFGVRNNLYLSAPYPARNGLDLWLRLDLPLGRGLRDFGPLELPFRAAREHRLWRQEPTP